MGADGDASAQVADDEVEVFVACALFTGIATRDGTLVEGVPDSDARHEGRSGNAGYLLQFVRYAGVGYKGAATGNAGGQVGGNEAAQITGMGT